MAKKLYVGNLPYGISSSDLERVFQEYGTVESAQVIMDRDTGRSKGFGFVEMASDSEAEQAIQALNGQDFNGRPLTVNEARPREPRVGAGSSGGGRRDFGGDRGGDRDRNRGGYGGSGSGKRW
ncbi:MAG: RNA-binding protein [Planctomycetia bacterium]|nr:RNA-binding protein [Planctomycetia bacterium]